MSTKVQSGAAEFNKGKRENLAIAKQIGWMAMLGCCLVSLPFQHSSGERMRIFRMNFLLKPGWREGERSGGLMSTINPLLPPYLKSGFCCFCPGWEALNLSQIYTT